MPTRKELIEELNGNFDDLTDAVADSRAAYLSASDAIEGAGLRLADKLESFEGALLPSSQALGRSIENAGSSLIAAIVGGVAVAVAGAMQAKFHDFLFDRVIHIRRLQEIVASVLTLEDKFGELSYDIAVKRSFAHEADAETRENIINELIVWGVIEETVRDGDSFLSIDVESDAYVGFWDWVNSVVDGLQNAGKSKGARRSLNGPA